MTRGQIKKAVRDRLAEDNTRQIAESFWLDDDLDAYIEEVIEEICITTDCIQDQFLINIVAGTISYSLDPIMLSIFRVKASNGKLFPHVTTSYLDANYFNWENTTSTPVVYVTDYTKGYLTLNCKPEDNMSLTVTASRLPITAMDSDNDIPEIPASYHRKMINGILYKASTKVGTPPTTMEKSAMYFQLYQRDLEEIYRNDIKGSPRSINFYMVDAGPSRRNVRSSYGF